MEIVYSLTGYRRVIKVYDWYEIQEIRPFRHAEWETIHRGYNLLRVIRKFEETSCE